VFGVSPEAFRARIRARHALKSIQNTEAPLASIAAELGFADQSHMTRSVKQLTGIGPQAWRSSAANGFKTRRTLDVSPQNENVRFVQSRNVRFHGWPRAPWKRSESL
jgi:AraC-like DNA-binding protein